jgi:SPP1 family predicted phage head-tail adaptor
MRAGRLRHRITIQHQVVTTGAQGSKKPSWVDLIANIPAEYEPLRGRDFVAANREQTELSAKFTLRYRRDIEENMRVVFHDGAVNVPFDIVGKPIDVKGRRIYLELMCKNGVKDGR